MLVHTLYGGRNFFTPQEYTSTSKTNSDRSRLPRVQSLIVGDILITKFSSSDNCYIYIGENMLLNICTAEIVEDSFDAESRLTRMISARHYFCVLRPSQMITQE
ncbi:MAG: hypothetical protein J6J23_03145 [Clostridia bacterium]|nr:hypothetical protein [Clostridia bacterium]